MELMDYTLKPNAFKLLSFIEAGYKKYSADEYCLYLNMSRGTFFTAMKQLEESGYIQNKSSIGYLEIRLLQRQ